MGKAAELALNNTILRGVVGSTAHGTSVGNTSDRDEMGICITPPNFVIGLDKFEHYTYRDQPTSKRSQAGDLDLTIYSLRKFCTLAIKGNPSVISLLYLPKYEILTEHGAALLSIRDSFISTEAGKRFLWYLISQKKSLLGEKSPKVQRPDLVEQFGYDTKFAMHALRLGGQGIEYLTTMNIKLPIDEPERSYLVDVRSGKYSKEEVLKEIEKRENTLTKLVDNLVILPDKRKVNWFLADIHLEYWGILP